MNRFTHLHSCCAFAATVLPAIVLAAPNVIEGDLRVNGDIHLPNFSIRQGAVFEVPGRVRFQRGGTNSPLPIKPGRVRAQPGGNFEIQPLGDYYRGALDIYPTQGKQPDFDALAELTIHRLHPTNEGHEMLSISALADIQSRFGVIVEAHGKGRIKPLDFQMIQGGLLAVDKDLQPFDAIAMRMKTDGTMQFSAVRNGGSPGPVDAIAVERDHPGDNGNFPSDYVRLTGKRMPQGETSDWRINAQVPKDGGSTLTVENRETGHAYEQKFRITSAGDVELTTPSAGVILTSPGGKKWRLSVNDDGELRTAPAAGDVAF